MKLEIKGLVLGIILTQFTLSVKSQTSLHSGAICRDTIPLFIRSDLFSKVSPDSGVFAVVSERVKVSIPRREDYLLANAIVELINRETKNLDSLQLKKVEFRIWFTTNTSSPWKSIEKNDVLVDTALSPNEQMLLEFRQIGHTKIIQRIKILRTVWQPAIAGFRSKNISDTFGTKLTAKAIYQNNYLPVGFTVLPDNTLNAEPGKEIEFALAYHGLSADSCVEVKLTDKSNGKSEGWQTTGHMITVGGLAARQSYVLELRYHGLTKRTLYNIQVAAYWWQEPIAICCFVLSGLAFIALMIFLGHRRKLKVKELQMEAGIDKCIKEQSKLDTHLVDNIFHSALGLIRSNQNNLAEQYLGNASGFLRDKLIYADKILVPFNDDIKSLRKFISNEQIKLGFQYSINIDPDLSVDEIQLPPLLWQPSLENSVKHGMAGNNGYIEINIGKRETDLVFAIRDNGKFIPKPRKPGSGFGIPITHERIIGLNMAYAEQKIIYEVKTHENGTVVNFIFRNWLE